jgi:hypothetical protein
VPSEGRRGRRDNGLDAVAYVPLLDVDPRVGEHLLDVLGSAGVPAYLEPSADVEPYTRALSLPSPPTDRLWVDREQRRQAREIVDAETPDGPRPKPRARDDEPSYGLLDAAEERAWREIVASWEAEPPPGGRAAVSPVPPWPADEDGDDEPVPAGGEAGDAAEPAPPVRGRAVPAHEPEEEDGEDGEDDEVEVAGPPELDEGHFSPPPPPPVPRPSRQAIAGVLVILVGVLLMAVPGVLGFDERTGLALGVAAVLGGGALLVLRLRETRGDDGPDDGAIV